MTCRRCGRENAEGNRFCGRCGSELKAIAPAPADMSDAKFCYRHPKEATLLSCGRCERPICTKCVVIGPAGPRCPDCAKMKVAVSAKGVAHDAFSSMRGILRMGPYSIYWLFLIFMLLGGAGRFFCRPSHPELPPDIPVKKSPEIPGS